MSLSQFRTSAPPLRVASFVDALPIPPVIDASRQRSIHLSLRAGSHQTHRDLPPTTIWGYNGLWPGPTIRAHRGQPLSIHWHNHLPERHLFPIDHTIHGAESNLPEVRTVTHVHGAFAMPESDGFPDAWSSPDGKTGPYFTPGPAHFSNHQPATTLWYHDHAIGITRLNIYAGLAGFYLIDDELEAALSLPRGRYDIPLMLQDRFFAPDGSLFYPAARGGTHPVWISELLGDVICVNGKIAPFCEVEPRPYRFRLLNASNARFYHLRLHRADEAGRIRDRSAPVPLFHQIGADGGLLPAPVISPYLLISPGERADIILDFTGRAGQFFTLNNDAPAPYSLGGESIPNDVLLFKVNRPLTSQPAPVPRMLVPFDPIPVSQAQRERILPLTEIERASDGYVVTSLLGQARWHEPVSEDPRAAATEIWSFLNTTADVHPIHVHLVRFQILNRQPFDVKAWRHSGRVQFTGPPLAPEPGEQFANKDTVQAYAGHLTRVIQRFDLPPGRSAQNRGDFVYVWHCHILEHEDNEMMRPYKVIAS